MSARSTLLFAPRYDQAGKYMKSQSTNTDSARDVQTLTLGVSVVNYFSSDSVSRLLNSLREFANGTNILVTIIDNSQDESQHELTQLLQLAKAASVDGLDVEVLTSRNNLGYGAGNNLGINQLLNRGATLLWVLNPDTTVTGSAADLLREVSGSQSSLWSTRTLEAGRFSHGLGELNTLTGRSKRIIDDKIFIKRFSVRYPGGHSILSLASTWRQIGGFDENYFLFMEEADLTYRSLKSGLSLDTIRSISVEHDQGLTTGSTRSIKSKSRVAFLESTKSRVIFFRKFYPFRLPLLVVGRIAYIFAVLCRGNAEGAKAVRIGLAQGLSANIEKEIQFRAQK